MITLLKHEFLHTRFPLALVAGIAILLAIAGTLLAMTGLPGIAAIGMVMTVVTMVAFVPATQVMLAVVYWRSSYGRMGYLTQTLPVKGARIYWAKMLWAWLVSLVAALLTAGILLSSAPLMAGGAGARPGSILTALREGWARLNELAPGWGVALAVAAIVALILIWPAQYFFAASIGSQAPINRLGVAGPVLVWVGVYLAAQLLIFLSFAAVPLAIGMDGGRFGLVRFDLFAEMSAGSDAAPDVMPVGFFPALLLLTVVCIAWSVRSWNRKVSLV